MEEKLEEKQLKQIDELVKHFVNNQELFSIALNSFEGCVRLSRNLNKLIHSQKSRIKDPDHLKDKLIRKAFEAKKNGIDFNITKDNLFSKINDLAGFRIIHLYTKQIELIDTELKKILIEQQWKIVEGPTAKSWDDESREYFKTIGFGVDPSPNMYTSVHYIIKPNSNSNITCEIQVRTLMEEVWGEVDHSINYPHKSSCIAIREQIKVLARVTSSCSRLVDSIFTTHNENISKNCNNSLPTEKIKKKK